ncbi:hypothetical protein ACSAZK_15165 [Methanosarcina sp. Mfa9]|uniref:hypothetical protein n=1 Tax=Methanosarcina sp. Mfa9 TaxID=3439063 RepID=UPI003F8747EA
MVDTLSGSIKEMQDSNNEILRTDIEIENISTNGVFINAVVRNTGKVKIREFENMDVIVHYNASGTMKTTWVPYLEGTDPVENSWVVTDITRDAINPGIFDPDEEMEIRIRMNTGEGVETGSLNNWIQITTPNGVYSSKYFRG